MTSAETDAPMPTWDDVIFTCIICEREVKGWSPTGPDMQVKPVCRYCEKTWGRAVMPASGSFRDRRITRQINALAEKLSTEANHMIWSKSYHAKT